MASPPNIDAVEYFTNHVLPKAGSIVELFHVIGAGASPELIDRLAGRCHFRGFAPDLAVSLQNYDVMVAPVRYGSGTKLKVLDAMALGLPLILSDCAAEGLELHDGKNAFIANSPVQILEALKDLANDPELGNLLAQNAHALASRLFSWERIRESLRRELSELSKPAG